MSFRKPILLASAALMLTAGVAQAGPHDRGHDNNRHDHGRHRGYDRHDHHRGHDYRSNYYRGNNRSSLSFIFNATPSYYRPVPVYAPNYYSPVYSAPVPVAPISYGAPVNLNNGRYCREYTQQVRVGGNIQQSYGTACLQPDGAWEINS